MTIAGTQSGAAGSVARAREGPSPLSVVQVPAHPRAQKVRLLWSFDIEVLRRVRPELLRTGIAAGRLELDVEEGARATVRLAAIGPERGSGGAVVLAATSIAESLRVARSLRDPVLGLEHLDVPGFAAITWRNSPSGPRMLYARSPIIADIGIPGARLESALGQWD